jgi:hypothetical protein
MKNFLIAAMVFLAFSQVEAQVTFSPGLRAGANFSHFSQGDSYYYDNVINFEPNTGQSIRLPETKFTSKTDFYVGFYGALKLSKFYTLQPEVTYSRQGSKLESYSYTDSSVRKTELQFDVSYISVGIINKFTFNDKFNMHIGPTIDILTEQSGNSNFQPQNFNNNYYYYDSYNANSDIDLAFVFGLGYNFTKNIGIEARVKKGIIPVLDFSDNHTNVVFSAGLIYTFDVSSAGSTSK